MHGFGEGNSENLWFCPQSASRLISTETSGKSNRCSFHCVEVRDTRWLSRKDSGEGVIGGLWG